MKFKKIAFLFPGQGAQIAGMGKDFYQTFSEAREVFEEGETILKAPFKNIIFNGPEEQLKETRYSQTAIFLTSMAIFRTVQKQFPDLIPYVTAGLSLGEYTALTVSKKISFPDCLTLVQYRGHCMHEACDESLGTMTAILGLPSFSVRQMVQELKNGIWVANFNSPEQTVISGTFEGVEKATIYAKANGAKKIIPLKVHGAFHSGLMEKAKAKLSEKIDGTTLCESEINFIMNVTGKIETRPQIIRDLLKEQVTESVQWEKSMNVLIEQEVELVLELGPGKTLAGLAKQNGIKAPILSINKIDDLETLNKLI